MSNEEYHNASPATKAYTDHAIAMSLIGDLPVGKCFILPLDYEHELLKEIANRKSVNGKAYVVIKWNNDQVKSFEIVRLPDGASPAEYYRTQQSVFTVEDDYVDIDEDVVKTIVRNLRAYRMTSINKIKNTYDKNTTIEMQENDVVSYAYMQRKMGSLAVFRNSPLETKKAFNKALDKVIDLGYLKLLEEHTYLTKAKLYQINLS